MLLIVAFIVSRDVSKFDYYLVFEYACGNNFFTCQVFGFMSIFFLFFCETSLNPVREIFFFAEKILSLDHHK